MNKRKILATLAVAAFVVSGILIVNAAFSSSPAADSPPANNEQPPIDDRSAEVRTSLPLFYRVNSNYMRGSEPAHGGISILVKLGVRTLVDLRSPYDHSDEIAKAAEQAGLQYYWLPLSVWEPPTHEKANEFISLVTDKSRGPFYVFCADGMHRTGEMTAIYRIVNDDWNIKRALAEMDEVGFSPYYYSLRNYVWSYARKFRPAAVL